MSEPLKTGHYQAKDFPEYIDNEENRRDLENLQKEVLTVLDPLYFLGIMADILLIQTINFLLNFSTVYLHGLNGCSSSFLALRIKKINWSILIQMPQKSKSSCYLSDGLPMHKMRWNSIFKT